MRLRALADFTYSFTGIDCTLCHSGTEYEVSDGFGRYAVSQRLAVEVGRKSLGDAPQNKMMDSPPKRKRGRPRKVRTND